MAAVPFKILHLEDNPVNALVVRKMLETADGGGAFDVSHADSLLGALGLIAQKQFDAALIDLNVPDSQGIDTFLAIQRNARSLPIVVLSGDETDSLAMKAVELGAQDFLVKTELKQPDLARALRYGILRSRKGAVEDDRGNAPGHRGIVALLGSKGGVGVTTLACHFARALKQQAAESLLLTGVDPSASGVAYLMKAQSQHSLADAAQNLHRLDSALWKAFVHTTDDGIDVLPPPGAANSFGTLEAERVTHVLRSARGLYAWIIIDLGAVNPLSLGLIEQVDYVYLVASEDVPALWEAAKQLKRARELGVPAERVRLIINQTRRRGGLPIGDLEKALGYPVEGSVTAAWEEQAELLATGRFVEEKSQIRTDVDSIVAKLLGKEAPKRRSSLLRFLGA